MKLIYLSLVIMFAILALQSYDIKMLSHTQKEVDAALSLCMKNILVLDQSTRECKCRLWVEGDK